jgi:hypothetical protein
VRHALGQLTSWSARPNGDSRALAEPCGSHSDHGERPLRGGAFAVDDRLTPQGQRREASPASPASLEDRLGVQEREPDIARFPVMDQGELIGPVAVTRIDGIDKVGVLVQRLLPAPRMGEGSFRVAY